MKNLRILLLAGLALAACGKQPAPEHQTDWKSGLTVMENNLIFTPVGGSATITLNETVTSASCSAAWITTAISGKVVTLTAAPHTGSLTRYTNLVLGSAVGSLTVPVSQYGVVIDGLVLEDIDAPVEGLVKTQTIRSNTTVTFTTDDGWIHPVYDAGESLLTVTIDENTAPGTRTGSFSYSVGGESGTVNVMQQPPLGRENAWTLTSGESFYEDPDFFLPVTLDCAASDSYRVFILPGDNVLGPIEDFIFSTMAPPREKLAPEELSKGPFSETLVLPGFGDMFVVVVGYGANGYITGQYQYIRLTVKDTRPGFFDSDGEDMDWGTF